MTVTEITNLTAIIANIGRDNFISQFWDEFYLRTNSAARHGRKNRQTYITSSCTSIYA